MDAEQLKTYVIMPVLNFLAPEIPFSYHAGNLLLGTAAQESRLHYIDQLAPGPGPAFGIFQMEAPTHDDIWFNFLSGKKALRDKVQLCSLDSAFYIDGAAEMAGNLYYATAMARAHYYRVKEALPTTLEGYARYWKRYYNTYLGKGKESEFIANYKEFIHG